MSELEKLLQQAKNSPNNMRFGDLCKLMELTGFIHRDTRGSHLVYSHPGIRDPRDSLVPVQKRHDGKARGYQVRDVLKLIEKYRLAAR